jgi:hypothetical protein
MVSVGGRVNDPEVYVAIQSMIQGSARLADRIHITWCLTNIPDKESRKITILLLPFISIILAVCRS